MDEKELEKLETDGIEICTEETFDALIAQAREAVRLREAITRSPRGQAMKGKAFINRLRSTERYINPEFDEMRLLADAAEIADEACQTAIKSLAFHVDGTWWDIGGPGSPVTMDKLNRALSYLDRRGLVERKAEAEHLVRFVGET